MFQEIEATALDVIQRQAAPAMALNELRDLVARERPGFTPPPVSMATVIQRMDGSIRMIATDERRLGWMVPVGWIVPPPGAKPPRTLVERLRHTLRRLGHSVEPGSGLALARWARMLREEARIRPLLESRQAARNGTGPLGSLGPGSSGSPHLGQPKATRRRSGGGQPRSTTRPQRPRPSRRNRAPSGPHA